MSQGMQTEVLEIERQAAHAETLERLCMKCSRRYMKKYKITRKEATVAAEEAW